jgi:hypothetical protein
MEKQCLLTMIKFCSRKMKKKIYKKKNPFYFQKVEEKNFCSIRALRNVHFLYLYGYDFFCVPLPHFFVPSTALFSTAIFTEMALQNPTPYP